MALKVFLTGGTGYIGGSVLHTIVSKHPEYDVTVLLRSVPDKFSTTYPDVKIVKGDYDSIEVISNAASEAEIVVHNGNSDHEPSLKAIIAGLLRRSNQSFLIHLSGSGIVGDAQNVAALGKFGSKTWSDVDDLEEISSRPDDSPHRNTEKLLFDTAAKHGDKLKIAIMSPPDIYGKGFGLGKTSSYFVPLAMMEAKKLGSVFYFAEGTNTRSWVHIQDLAKLYLNLVEAAAAGGEGAAWGKEGYYFSSSQEAAHIDVVKALGSILKKHGVIENAEPVEVNLEQLDQTIPYFFPGLSRYLFASNLRTRPDRAKKLFGYSPNAPTLMDTLEEDVLAELKNA